MLAGVSGYDERLEFAVKDCKGPYRTIKLAIVAVFQNCHKYGYHGLYVAEIQSAIWEIEERICRKGSISRDRICSAIGSLVYDGVLKTRGDGHYRMGLRHLPELPANSAYNLEKKKIEQREQKGKQKKEFVYFVQWENDSTHVKIGYSTSPAQRFSSFLTSCPQRLVVLRVQTVKSQQEEALLHERFEPYRKTREWFEYRGELKEYIESLDCSIAIEIDKELSEEKRQDIFVHYF
jgi:hypothetical protein